MTEEYLKLRQKNYKTQSAKLKKRQDSNGNRAEDIKACDDETRENGETNLQRDLKEEQLHT